MQQTFSPSLSHKALVYTNTSHGCETQPIQSVQAVAGVTHEAGPALPLDRFEAGAHLTVAERAIRAGARDGQPHDDDLGFEVRVSGVGSGAGDGGQTCAQAEAQELLLEHA